MEQKITKTPITPVVVEKERERERERERE